MTMELDRAEKPLLQLRKLLKTLPSNPAPDEVHELRIRARKIEAVGAALKAADAKRTKRLLKLIKPVRKAAGGVRDMDVLTGNLLHMPQNADHEASNDALIRLVEHLGTVRRKSAGHLLDVVNRQRRPARRSLKNYAKLVESVVKGKKPAPIEIARTLESTDGSGSPASSLMAELRKWPRLNAQNIHTFRLKVKQLRYVLQLFPGADRGLVDSLGKVKDEIGDWHDWQQLLGIARDILDARKDKALLAEIDAAVKEKLAHALAGTNALRRRYLKSAPPRRKAS
jgi:CHAD domain-containing protein